MIPLTQCVYALLILPRIAYSAPAAFLAVSSASAVDTVSSLPSSIVSSAGISASLSLASEEPSSSTASAAEPSSTVPFASTDPNLQEWDPSETTGNPQPIRGPLGASILGPNNVEIMRQNPDLAAPPTTDHGSVYVNLHLISCSRLIYPI